MMQNQTIILFAGTSEGRELAERCAAAGRNVIVCVATEYGEKILPECAGIRVHTGRMDEQNMREFLKEHSAGLVIDATHPYARLVSETIRNVCKELQMECVRLVRASGADLPQSEHIHVVDDVQSAAKLAEQMQGNIFLATGSKELAVFVQTIRDFSRLYARVLSTAETFDICKKLGFEGRQLICMQGPFSQELNREMYLHTDAKILVTKESGDAGGFSDKVQAALALGMHCIVIRRPLEQGLTYAQVCERLEIHEENGELALVGIGMGTSLSMTQEARKALDEAQVIFGAKRMLEAVRDFPVQQVCEYRKAQILDYLNAHPQFTRAAVVFSGDVGFYSGADAFAAAEFSCGGKQWKVCRIAGISSVNYFAAKLGIPWQDVKLCSVHGRKTDLALQIARNRRVFSLLNGGEQLAELSEELLKMGMNHIRLSVGFDLGYETEEIWHGCPDAFVKEPQREGLCVALFENDSAQTVTTGNLPDAAFQRDRVPLTKEEIRAVALSKLRLTSDAVCYDIGAGTGGMTLDIARFVPEGKVIAFERSDEACALVRANAKKPNCGNAAAHIEVVQGSAPDILEGYEAPTHAFIGGSGGKLSEIVTCLLAKNPTVRIVIDAITLETVSEANELLKTLPVTDVDIVSVSVAKAKHAGAYQLMESMNPVYIFSFTGAVVTHI